MVCILGKVTAQIYDVRNYPFAFNKLLKVLISLKLILYATLLLHLMWCSQVVWNFYFHTIFRKYILVTIIYFIWFCFSDFWCFFLLRNSFRISVGELAWGSSAPFIRIDEDEESMRPGHCLWSLLCAFFSALILLVWCQEEHLAIKPCAIIPQRFSSRTTGGRKLKENWIDWVHLENGH